MEELWPKSAENRFSLISDDPLSRRHGARILILVGGAICPCMAMLMTFERGDFFATHRLASISLHPGRFLSSQGVVPFLPLLLYPIVSLAVVLFGRKQSWRHLVIRYGMYSGLILALQYWVIVGMISIILIHLEMAFQFRTAQRPIFSANGSKYSLAGIWLICYDPRPPCCRALPLSALRGNFFCESNPGNCAMKRSALVLLALLTMLAATFSARQGRGNPFTNLISGERVEADPDREYVMTETNGPWMIMATTFSGEGAAGQARELVLELRKKYKLEAYTHEMKFDFTDDVAGRGVDRYGQPVRMQYRRSGEFQEIAVLVGNYAQVDDHEAQRNLQKIKYMVPETLDTEGRGRTAQSLALLRTVQVALLPDNDRRKEQGPMRKAFISRNPLLPRDYFVPQGIDPLVVEMNQGVKYNLLDSGARYTVQVATFTGTVVLDQKKVQDYENGAKMKSKLDDAAEKAHRLTLALRHKGYEAFEFHDRYASIVTVGAYDTVGKPRLDGKTEINPNIHAIMRTFAAEPASAGSQAGTNTTAYMPQVFVGIPLDIQPQIVEVPRQSLSAAYAR